MIEIIDDVIYGTIGFIDGIRGFFQTIADGLRSLLDQGVKGAFILAGIILGTCMLFCIILSCDRLVTLIKVLLSIAAVIGVLVAIVWGIGVVLAFKDDIIQLIFAVTLLFSLGCGTGGVIFIFFRD